MKKTFDISDLIRAGIVGSVLGKLIIGDNSRTMLSSLIGIGVTATYQSYLESTQAGNVLIIDDNKLFEVDKKGKRTFLRDVPKQYDEIPTEFTV